MEMRFGTWNIRSFYKAGSPKTVSKEVSRYRVDLVGVQEVRWEGSGTETAGEYTFCMERGMRTLNWLQGFCT
jgi:exonuclease III